MQILIDYIKSERSAKKYIKKAQKIIKDGEKDEF